MGAQAMPGGQSGARTPRRRAQVGKLPRFACFERTQPIILLRQVWHSCTKFVLHEIRVTSTLVKNVTITVDDTALEWVRVEAAKRNTSVSRLVGEMLQEKMQLADAYQRALHDWQAKERPWCSNGNTYPCRNSPEGTAR